MTRWTRLVSALAVRNLLHLYAIVWLSIVALLGRLVRPEVISAVGPRDWIWTVLLLFILLYGVWISLVMMVRRDARLFAAPGPNRTRRAANRRRGDARARSLCTKKQRSPRVRISRKELFQGKSPRSGRIRRARRSSGAVADVG